MQAEYFVDELSLIADDGRNDFMRRMREHGEEFVAVDREHLERSKIRIGTRQWLIERILANKYGPKPQVVALVSGYLDSARCNRPTTLPHRRSNAWQMVWCSV